MLHLWLRGAWVLFLRDICIAMTFALFMHHFAGPAHNSAIHHTVGQTLQIAIRCRIKLIENGSISSLQTELAFQPEESMMWLH